MGVRIGSIAAAGCCGFAVAPWAVAGDVDGVGLRPVEVLQFGAAGGSLPRTPTISDDGSLIALEARFPGSGSDRWPARWTPSEGIVPLEGLEGLQGVGSIVSGDGSRILGTANDAGSSRAYEWIGPGDVRIFGPPAGIGSVSIKATSTDGRSYVGRSVFPGPVASAYVVQDGGPQTPLGGDRAAGISGDGSIVVGSEGPLNAIRTWIWTEATGRVFPPELGASVRASANGVSRDGSTVFGAWQTIPARGVEPERQGFAWTATDGARPLFNVGQSSLFPRVEASNADGSVIAGRAWEGGFGFAVVWLDDSPQPVLARDYLTGLGYVFPEGLTLSRVTGLSADGLSFTGEGVLNGAGVVWAARVPTPGAAGVLGVAGLALTRRRRRLGSHPGGPGVAEAGVRATGFGIARFGTTLAAGAAVTVAAAGTALASGHDADRIFELMTFAPGVQGEFIRPSSIANDGSAVAIEYDAPGGVGRPAWWRAGVGIEPLSGFADTTNVEVDIAGDAGTLFGQAALGSASRGFVWRPGEGRTLIQPPAFVGSSNVTATSDDGSILGGNANFSSGLRAYRSPDNGGTLVELGGDRLVGLSADGSVAAGVDLAGERSPWRWTEAGGVEPLGGFGPEPDATPLGISADGEVIFGVWTRPVSRGAETERVGFVWSESTSARVLDNRSPSVLGATPRDASADGSVIVGRAYDASAGFGAVWLDFSTSPTDASAYLQGLGYELPAGLTITDVTGVSADGLSLTGTGRLGIDGVAWVARVPGPGSAGVLLPACGMAGGRRRRAGES